MSIFKGNAGRMLKEEFESHISSDPTLSYEQLIKDTSKDVKKMETMEFTTSVKHEEDEGLIKPMTTYQLSFDETFDLMIPEDTVVNTVGNPMEEKPIHFYRFYDSNGCWHFVMNYWIKCKGDFYIISQRHSINEDNTVSSHSPLDVTQVKGDETDFPDVDRILLQECLELNNAPILFTRIFETE